MIGVVSDIGTVRSLNEDFALFYEGEDYKIFVVADGMGGHNAGEVASKLAAEVLINYVKKNYNGSDKENLLLNGIKEANREVFFLSTKSLELNGMGTTLTACLVTKEFTYVGNVGDSCCFGLTNNDIIKLTKDHSLVQELLDSGGISEEEAIKHPKKNIITRAIGTEKDVEVDIFKYKCDEFTNFMLCSDGLANEVSKEEILYVIKNEEDYNKICESLVQIAKKNGGRDNITVLFFGGEI